MSRACTLRANQPLASEPMAAGRRHNTPGSEKKDFTTHRAAGSVSFRAPGGHVGVTHMACSSPLRNAELGEPKLLLGRKPAWALSCWEGLYDMRQKRTCPFLGEAGTPCLITKAVHYANLLEKTVSASACNTCRNLRDPQRTVSHQ